VFFQYKSLVAVAQKVAMEFAAFRIPVTQKCEQRGSRLGAKKNAKNKLCWGTPTKIPTPSKQKCALPIVYLSASLSVHFSLSFSLSTFPAPP
jgi:hypothetical protein